MRRGEILGLEWARIDLASSRITLLQTKSGKPRGVPINRAVYDALVALQPDAAKRTSGRLFLKRSGGAWGEIRTAFTKACERAGIVGFRFHDLRHTAASHMVMRGASLAEVKDVLGAPGLPDDAPVRPPEPRSPPRRRESPGRPDPRPPRHTPRHNLGYNRPSSS